MKTNLNRTADGQKGVRDALRETVQPPLCSQLWEIHLTIAYLSKYDGVLFSFRKY